MDVAQIKANISESPEMKEARSSAWLMQAVCISIVMKERGIVDPESPEVQRELVKKMGSLMGEAYTLLAEKYGVAKQAAHYSITFQMAAKISEARQARGR